jgi:hypothetical protein
MPNTNSNGKFGTSMDYSQLLEIRRKYIGVNEMRVANPTNDPGIKPHFNQDKLVRDFRTSGAVDFYFTRGLTPVYRRVGTGN